LRTIRATIIAGVALPLSLIATFGIMWFCGFSLDNLSLMALTIGTGFVVDDAIVMIENIVRHMEDGEAPFEAAPRGASEIGFRLWIERGRTDARPARRREKPTRIRRRACTGRQSVKRFLSFYSCIARPIAA
jgi:hypothetical protein